MNHHIPVLFLFVACAPALTEDNATEQTAKTLCKKSKKCDTDPWRDLYDEDMNECVDEQTDFYDAVLGLTGFIGVQLDLDELGGCLADVRRASCEEFEDGDIGPDCDDILSF